MEIKFIGTGSGKTSLSRFHSSFILSFGNYNLLIDAGDGISRALLNQNFSYNKVDAVLFSHFHPDHYCGLPSLVVQMKLNQRESPLKIFASASRIQFIKNLLESSFLFEDRLGFEIKYQPFEAGEKFSFYSVEIEGRQNSHIAKYGEKVIDDLSLSFNFNAGGKNIFYSGDIGSADDLFLFKEKHADVFITESTHIDLQSLEEVLLKLHPAGIFLTHIPDEKEEEIKLFIHNNRSRLNITAAYDGLTVYTKYLPGLTV